jgi:hypothetical protein
MGLKVKDGVRDTPNMQTDNHNIPFLVYITLTVISHFSLAYITLTVTSHFSFL